MIDGLLLVDVHLHPAARPSLKLEWTQWMQNFDSPVVSALYGPDGRIVPAAFAQLLAEEGVDFALLLAEYSPRVTGQQAIEDLLPLVAHDPARIGFAANVNPHLHFPIAAELQRQITAGAMALKVHPVHGGFPANDPEMFPAYDLCQSAQLPLVVHCGTSTFPGAMNRYGDPVLLDDVLRNFPRLEVVLAHGGRGWWYDAAAYYALSNDRVWIELSGLPPSRLRTYYAKHNWNRLTRRMIFATDWPGIPGIAVNARAVAALCPDDETKRAVLADNAVRVYGIRLSAAPS